MFGFFFLVFTAISFFPNFGEAVKCYHCYDSYTANTSILRDFEEVQLGGKLVRCDKNKIKWNSWDCPTQWPICVHVSAKVKDHYEIVRSCAERNFCSNYNPPPGVKLMSCTECNTTLCNDYAKLPEPPTQPGPLLVFNINVNLSFNNCSTPTGSCK